ncbi:MAG TPA: ADP-ribosylglycohydrolase [Rhodobacteraceae bacterium]|nr:ADP-ribosylglycohydrolase [Paracoccaceae bacterium]
MARENPDHNCPGCGTAQTSVPRYPWYFCQACLKLAEDEAGNRLEFSNAGMSGGLVWRYTDDKSWREAGAVACLIKGRPVMVQEARFGGIVAEPLREGRFHDHGNLTDLRG